jgi:hypothetical protein
MQGDVRGDAAARFATGLYAALTRGMTIDTAVVEGRKRMLAVAPDDERDWALPSLVLRTLPEKVLDMEADSPIAIKRQIVTDPFLKNVAGFVGRRDERRRLRQGAELRAPTPQLSKLLLVVGESQVGKTWLVWRCLEGCLLRGHLVVHVSFKDQRKTFNALDVLRLIRGSENEPAGALRPNIYQHFDPFNAALYHLLRGRSCPSRPGPSATMVSTSSLASRIRTRSSRPASCSGNACGSSRPTSSWSSCSTTSRTRRASASCLESSSPAATCAASSSIRSRTAT